MKADFRIMQDASGRIVMLVDRSVFEISDPKEFWNSIYAVCIKTAKTSIRCRINMYLDRLLG